MLTGFGFVGGRELRERNVYHRFYNIYSIQLSKYYISPQEAACLSIVSRWNVREQMGHSTLSVEVM